MKMNIQKLRRFIFVAMAAMALLVAVLLAVYLSGQTPRGPESSPPHTTLANSRTSTQTLPKSAPPPPSLTPSPLPSLSPSPPQPVYSVADFFPLKDIHIRYNTQNPGEQLDSYTQYIHEQSGTLQKYHLTTDSDTETSRVEIYRLSPESLEMVYYLTDIPFVYNFTEYEASRLTETVIKVPIAVGTKWEVKNGTREITAVGHELTVPAGSFQTLEITTTYTNGKTVLQYYAAGCGLIEQIELDRNNRVISSFQATSVESANTYVRTIRLYFAHPELNTVFYTDREITFKINTIMRRKLQNELQSPPSAAGLIPLPPNVQMLSINLDLRNDAVKVNFSHNLITDLALSPQGEALFLQSLTNTIAGYYRKSKVLLLVESQPYQTANIQKAPGEYFYPDFTSAAPLTNP